MKKIILIIMLFSSACFSQPTGMLEIGRSTLGDYTYATAQLGYRINLFGIQNLTYGGWTTWFDYSHEYQRGKPFLDIYSIGNKTKFKDVYFKVYHYCAHFVDGKKESEITLDFMRGNMTAFAVGFEF